MKMKGNHMSEQFKLGSSVGLILRNQDSILLIRRANTGYRDGFYACPGGRLDGGESVTQTAIREAREELGIIVLPTSVELVHAVHIWQPQEKNRETIGFFARVTAWEGEPVNNEPEKHDDIGWFNIDDLPKNLLPTHAHILEKLKQKVFYSELGWS